MAVVIFYMSGKIMRTALFSVKDLSKTYDEKKVIDYFSYQFHPGCYAILGPNGVGKSTLLRLLVGAIQADSGVISLNGYLLSKNPVHVKSLLSYVPDQMTLYPFLTGSEFLNLILCLRSKVNPTDVTALLQEFKIEAFLNTKIEDMSLGTQKKILITAALIHSPPLIVMDEPTNSIDLEAVSILTRHLQQVKSHTIVLVSTHDMEFISDTQATQIHLEKKEYEKTNPTFHGTVSP